ncbi:MAG: Eco57I restriction-modification methylase domain-containing protein, partial [Pyrobaculum sp.]
MIASLNLLGVAFDSLREVHQNVLPREVRRSIGEFYTSDKLVDETLDVAGLDDRAVRELYERWKQAMRDVVILDPACGSGSFLVAATRRIFGTFGDKPPADIASFIKENVVGIDINPFAVEMAKLNVIATNSEETRKRGGAYTPQKVQIYWADSLARVRDGEPLYYKTLKIDGPALQQAIGVGRIEVPHCGGVGPLEVLDEVIKLAERGGGLGELAENIAERRGVRPDLVRQDLGRLFGAVRRIFESGNGRVVAAIKNTLAVHDLLGRCSYVIGNPPRVRIHRVDAGVRSYVTESYSWVGSDSAFNPNFKRTVVPLTRQIDYSVAFVQRGFEYLREGGVLAYVITSQIARATYAGRMREELLRYALLRLVDYSLYPIPLFPDAVSYPLVIAVKKSPPPQGHKVRVTVYNTGGDHRDFELEQDALPLYAGTKYPNAWRSPWVLAPPEVRSTVQKIIASGQRLGDVYEVMMGVKTSLNEQYIGTLAGCDKTRGIVKLQLEGGRTVDVEEFLVHPFVRGEGVDPYDYKWDELVIFPHDVNTLEPLWDPDQRRVLELLGLLGRGVRISASGGVAVYEVSLEQPLACNRIGAYVRDVEQRLRGAGFDAQRVSPCGV